jgi:hypothetical protein
MATDRVKHTTGRPEARRQQQPSTAPTPEGNNDCEKTTSIIKESHLSQFGTMLRSQNCAASSSCCSRSSVCGQESRISGQEPAREHASVGVEADLSAMRKRRLRKHTTQQRTKGATQAGPNADKRQQCGYPQKAQQNGTFFSSAFFSFSSFCLRAMSYSAQ